ncbi:RagB/SusD family nutrient uptake outer membrane protein [Flavisolibacter nicotianae]|uniref:RagB/SusD family nutrient uptake outer membrane protein n=1 Tax=Flavisolibacter nicotianae TaxID=2364882 RepID=UPI000EACBA09|nr:RagB/SusD family nutrient uptake outer membrane protein [Flavisolibacter nicotianae]
MKPIYKLVAVGLLLTGYSCKKELYKDPIGLLTPNQISTDPTLNTVQSSVKSSYQMLSNTLNILGEWRWDLGTVFRNDYILYDMASDDVQKKWNPDGDQAWMDQVSSFNFTASNQGFNGQWSYDYEGISRSNLAISYLSDQALTTKIGLDPQLKNRLLGEVYFLRAFYYFDLVNNFGDVPLLLKPLENFAEAYSVSKRESKDNVLAQINTDLAQAKTLLPTSKYSDNTEKWRVSKGAVIALQAKVALYTAKWQDVINAVNELETLGYSLNARYFDSFDVTKEFAENEVIFAYDHQSGQTPRNGNGISAPLDWGFIAPTTAFLNAFEPNDPRLEYTVNVPQKAVYKLLGATNTTYKGNDDAPTNKIYIRFADALLWKAEAYNELGNAAQAIALINKVRARARTTVRIDGTMPPAGTLPDRDGTVTDKALIKSWLIQERRVELGFESARFNDLKRWKIAKQVLTAAGKNFQDYNYVYPIPQGEIDKSGGSITQNPGY